MTAIDLFAGLGGSTEGAEQAGVRVVWFANHWRPAVDVAAANHPNAEPKCQDLCQAPFDQVPRTDVGMASPCCQGHTHARGVARPHHDASRSTAWAPIACAEVHRQDAWVIENVHEFLTWTLFPSWVDAWHRLGYAVAPHLIDSADHGVPQNRRRVFIVCTRSKAPLQLTLPKLPHVPVSTILEETGTWSSVRSKCLATRRRVQCGRRDIGPRFLMPYYAALKLPQNRLRKWDERKADGTIVANPGRMGPLTMDARRWGMEQVLAIQAGCNAVRGAQPEIDLINADEQARIEELIAANTWPDRWSGEEMRADTPVDDIRRDGSIQRVMLDLISHS